MRSRTHSRKAPPLGSRYGPQSGPAAQVALQLADVRAADAAAADAALLFAFLHPAGLRASARAAEGPGDVLLSRARLARLVRAGLLAEGEPDTLGAHELLQVPDLTAVWPLFDHSWRTGGQGGACSRWDRARFDRCLTAHRAVFGHDLTTFSPNVSSVLGFRRAAREEPDHFRLAF